MVPHLMPTIYHKTTRLMLTAIVMILLESANNIYSETPQNIIWQVKETNHTVIRFQRVEDLKLFNARIDYSPEKWSLKYILGSTNPEDLNKMIEIKVDSIFERVQSILDMRKKIRKVTINIFQDKKQLHNAYYKLSKQQCRVRAWYSYETNSVYIQLNDLHEGMLAHELAHAIIDHCLLIPPPPATAEILARYVDTHISE